MKRWSAAIHDYAIPEFLYRSQDTQVGAKPVTGELAQISQGTRTQELP